MSVLIKDMEKPKYCYAVIDGESEYCPFVNTDDDCVILLKKGICEGTWEEQYSKCPLIEEPERKKGKWLELTNTNHTYVCSVCGRMLVNITDGKNTVTKNYPFCHCGADMRGNSDDV